MMDLFALDKPNATISTSDVLTAIRTVRIRQAGLAEADIHDAVCAALKKHGIGYRREHVFGQGCRADIWVDGTDPEMQEALGLKVSQFIGLMGDTPETEEDQALSVQASTQHMRKVLEKLRACAK